MASISFAPLTLSEGPTALIFPPVIATSPTKDGAPVPSTIITMLVLHRGISTLHSKFAIEKKDVDALVEMGR